MPAHILPGTRGCSPSGAVLVRTYVSRASSGSGWQAAGRQAGFRSGWRAQAAHSPFARGSRSAAAQSGSAGRQAAAHRASGTVSAEWEGRNMHTCTHVHVHTCCIQTATQHVTTHRHAVTRPCPRALSSPVSARARPLCLLPSVLQSGRRRGSRRAAAATSPTRTDLPRPRRWRGRACTAGAGPRGREGRRARRARERRRRRLARAGLRGVGRGTTCSGRSARSAQLGDDEGDHAARSANHCRTVNARLQDCGFVTISVTMFAKAPKGLSPAPRLRSCRITVVAVRCPLGALLQLAASHVILMHGRVCGLPSSGTSSAHSAARRDIDGTRGCVWARGACGQVRVGRAH